MKASQETLVFTTKCLHASHFSYIVAHVKSHASLVCPVYSSSWCSSLSIAEKMVHSLSSKGQQERRRIEK